MVNEKMYQLGSAPSAIRELFAYGLARKEEIGAENVFDFSIGNPSIPAPPEVKQAIIELLDEPPVDLHGYTPAQGTPAVRKAIADSISNRFGVDAQPGSIYMTAGAAASLAISLKAVAEEGDEFIVIAPYFPEYRVWIEAVGGVCVEVPAREIDFQLDLAAIEAAITPKTKGIIINSPNNPVGAVYSEDNLRGLADILRMKQELMSRVIYLICDEPYRELVYEGVSVPFAPVFYENAIVCYSYSKSFSLPGERIGYLYVSERMVEADRVYASVCGAGRALGFVCAPSLFQGVIERCVNVPIDVTAYAENRVLLASALSELGYEFIEPQGAFYLWVKALEPNAEAFVERAKALELLLVSSTSFGCEGYVRISYCVDKATITNALPAFKTLAESYRPL